MKRDELDRREREFREALRGRRAEILPDASFSARVLQRLPAAPAWTLDWAARRVLPASLGLAVVLGVAAMAVHGSGPQTVATSSPTAPQAPTSTRAGASHGAEGDPLEWILQGDAVSR